MMTRGATSTVEGVGSREQGNTQTQGELHTSSKGATRGQKSKNKHTANNYGKPISRRDKGTRQQTKPNKYTDKTMPNRQRRASQWCLCAGYNAKNFKKSCDLDPLMTEPSYEDLINEVDRKNCFAVAQDGQEEASKRLEELKAFKGSKLYKT